MKIYFKRLLLAILNIPYCDCYNCGVIPYRALSKEFKRSIDEIEAKLTLCKQTKMTRDEILNDLRKQLLERVTLIMNDKDLTNYAKQEAVRKLRQKHEKVIDETINSFRL